MFCLFYREYKKMKKIFFVFKRMMCSFDINIITKVYEKAVAFE